VKSAVAAVLTVMVAAAIVIADDLRCSICNQVVKGEYIRYSDGELVCETCFKNAPRCDICSRPSVNNVLVDGKKVCRKCLPKLPICGVCGRRIAEDYFRDPGDGAALCRQCFGKADRCFVCGAIGKNLVAAGSKKACPNCLKLLIFCSVCGEPISGTGYWFENDDSKRYCADCWNRFPHCSNCDAPVGPRGVDLSDGRTLCQACYKSAIFQSESVTEIKLEVLAFLKSELDMELMHKVSYYLQGIDFIRSRLGESTGDLYGLFCREGDKFSIHVLFGLSRKLLYQVLAHEIGHAWLSERRADEPDRRTNEGFAQWVAYHSLMNFGYPRDAEKLLDGNDDYAVGLKEMLELEKRGGKKAVFLRVLGADHD